MTTTPYEKTETAATALQSHWHDSHPNEPGGYQRMLAAHVVQAIEPTYHWPARHRVMDLPAGTVVLLPAGYPVEKCKDGNWYMPRVEGDVSAVFTAPENYPVTIVRSPEGFSS